MMDTRRLAILSAMVMLCLSGCSLMPYENEFACQLEDNLGKCVSVSEAYEEAVTGIEEHPPLIRHSEQDDASDAGSRTRQQLRKRRLNGEEAWPVTSVSASVEDRPVLAQQDVYGEYQSGVYKKLHGLIQQPRTPMLAAPRTVRTMILPYSSALNQDRLWMPRFVYSIVQEPRFVLGNYLHERETMSPMVMPFGSTAPEDKR